MITLEDDTKPRVTVTDFKISDSSFTEIVQGGDGVSNWQADMPVIDISAHQSDLLLDDEILIAWKRVFTSSIFSYSNGNLIGAGLGGDGELSISIIVDGFHLTREEVRSFYKVKGLSNTILVSDALDLAGLTPGLYTRGEREVLLTPDVIKFPAEDVLAGAASPVTSCITNMMEFTGCSLSDAIGRGAQSIWSLWHAPFLVALLEYQNAVVLH